MNRKVLLLSALIGSILFSAFSWTTIQDKRAIQAIIIKVIYDVDKSTAKGWEQAVPLDRLRSGQEVRTAAKSVALIRFADETKLIVREKSIVQIKGEVEGREILNREVHTTRGNIAFNVKKSEKEQFRFTSPISVASIRGTEGSYIVVSDSLNMLIINQGLATFTNLISNVSVDVGAGQIGTANDKGDLDVRQASPQELEKSSTDESTQEPPAKKKREIKMKGEDKAGNPKIIIIEWEEEKQ